MPDICLALHLKVHWFMFSLKEDEELLLVHQESGLD